ncbi:glycosyl transferase [Desulfovibrio desulfuricans]|uniref:Glycosyl transferase n=1 Tax=Desulfovibrio desulfuricans TaxID=876 RepID=A0A4P7UEV4_DESDE|nr:glycosyltransferase [Desulfovibrio desulfuricans]QCC84345.1 glycosyl transferase [Desulfovibrio desulfuricans]
MKTVFCLDDKIQYLTLLKVAVRSLRAVQGSEAPCLCVYAGSDAALLAELEAENIPVARYAPRLDPSGFTPLGQACAGCFLKLELALVPELAQDDRVLYCDTDVLFYRPLDELFAQQPTYVGMAREYTAPFFHQYQQLSYEYRGASYTVPLPFPIWTYSSGVALFNLDRLRKRDFIGHFMAFCKENESRIGNLDQSLINYFFGKRITRLDDCWNCPPYREECRDAARIVHFHGPKPWEHNRPELADLRINHYPYMRERWMEYLTSQERALVQSWA